MSGYQPGDTIAAASTPAGSSALAVLRISGPRALELAGTVLCSTPAGLRPRTTHLVELNLTTLLGAEAATVALTDRAVLNWWPAPATYTGEELVELSIHGNPLLLRLCLNALQLAGARLAEPGEFSYRACINGKLDLLQAEAVNELIIAGSRSALRLASAAVSGLPSARLRGWVARLTELLAGIEVIHDYAADDLDASLDQASLLTADKLLVALNALQEEMQAALEQSRRSAPLRGGITVAICGPPNVGKSTLFNALLGQERSITAPQPGTTRDYVSESLEEAGLHLTLVDTAGYRDAADAVEAAGVRRAGEWARSADVLLWVNAADEQTAALPDVLADSQTALLVLTRCDRLSEWPTERADLVCVSGSTGQGLDALRGALTQLAVGNGEASLDSFNQRQAGRVAEARASLSAASAALSAGMPMDAVSLDLYAATEQLHGIYESQDREAVINAIFAGFCVGK